MSDEVPGHSKLPNFSDEEIEWLEISLGIFKPKLVYFSFLEHFPRFLEYADAHGISDQDLRAPILDRFYAMKKDTRRGSHRVIKKIENTITGVLQSRSVLAHLAPIDHLERIRRRIKVMLDNIDSYSLLIEEGTFKDFLTMYDKYLKVVSSRQKIDKNADVPLLGKLLTKEDTTQAQPQGTQNPDQVEDRDDDSWLEGSDEEANEPE